MTDPNEEKGYELAEDVVLDGPADITIVDDTPDEDKGRTPMAQAPAEVTDDELSKYSDQKLKDRLA
jgi:hypothetical protein